MKNSKKQYIDVKFVRTLMKSNNISEEEMADLLGIRLAAFENFLNGADQTYMSSNVLYKLAIIFNISANSLLNKDYRYHETF